MNEKWSEKEFRKHLHKSFRINDREGKMIVAELVDVSGHGNEQIEAFSILFKGPKNIELPHDVLTIDNEEAGKHDLLLGPVLNSRDDGIYYEAVFTKLKEQ